MREALIGIGLAAVFFFLSFVVKAMPPALTWTGIVCGALFVIWGLLSSHDRVPMMPALFLVVFLSGSVGSAIWLFGELRSPSVETPTSRGQSVCSNSRSERDSYGLS